MCVCVYTQEFLLVLLERAAGMGAVHGVGLSDMRLSGLVLKLILLDMHGNR